MFFAPPLRDPASTGRCIHRVTRTFTGCFALSRLFRVLNVQPYRKTLTAPSTVVMLNHARGLLMDGGRLFNRSNTKTLNKFLTLDEPPGDDFCHNFQHPQSSQQPFAPPPPPSSSPSSRLRVVVFVLSLLAGNSASNGCSVLKK